MAEDPQTTSTKHDGVVGRAVDEVRDEEHVLEERIAHDQGAIKTDNYSIVFVLILLTLVGTALYGGGRIGSLLLLALQSLTLIVALRVSRVHPRTMLAGSATIVLAFLGVTVAMVTDIDRVGSSYSLVMVALVALAPVVIARRLVTHERITLQTVFGALSIYLLVGLFYAVIYAELQKYAAPFFVQTDAPASSDFVYYSFTTLTTVGYGDFTAASPLGRLTSITEGLLGQIYLVTIIALLVGHIGKQGPARQRRQRRPSKGASTDDARREETA